VSLASISNKEINYKINEFLNDDDNQKE